MAVFSSFVLNNFGTPGLSELTECGAPEIEEPKNYIGAFVLNGVFTLRYPEPMKRLVLMFARRADNAVREYREGRDLLLSYVRDLPQGNHHFLRALRATTHFEHCIGSACHADALLERLIDITGTREHYEAPVNGEGAKRLKAIWNRVKHFDEDIVSKKATEDITAPAWLTNTGISAETATVTWPELYSILTDQQTTLKFFAEDLPKTVAEERKACKQTRATENKEL